MSQTAYISFLIFAAFAVYIATKGEWGTYVGFLTTTGNDAVSPTTPKTTTATAGQASAAIDATGKLLGVAELAGFI